MTTPPGPDDATLQRLNDEMNDASYRNDYFQGTLITPDRLYIDLSLLRDTRLGALITLILERPTAEADYTYLVSRLGVYGKRIADDFAHLFPELKLTNAAIAARQADPAWAGRVFGASPITWFFRVLKAQIAVNTNHSQVKGKRDPVRMVVNTHPLVLPPDHRHLLGTFLARYLGVEVEPICLAPESPILAERLIGHFTPKGSTVMGMDEIYTDRLDQLQRLTPGFQQALSALTLYNRRIFMAALVGREQPTDPAYDAERELEKAAAALNLATNFHYIPTSVLAPDPDPTRDIAEAPIPTAEELAELIERPSAEFPEPVVRPSSSV